MKNWLSRDFNCFVCFLLLSWKYHLVFNSARNTNSHMLIKIVFLIVQLLWNWQLTMFLINIYLSLWYHSTASPTIRISRKGHWTSACNTQLRVRSRMTLILLQYTHWVIYLLYAYYTSYNPSLKREHVCRIKFCQRRFVKRFSFLTFAKLQIQRPFKIL